MTDEVSGLVRWLREALVAAGVGEAHESLVSEQAVNSVLGLAAAAAHAVERPAAPLAAFAAGLAVGRRAGTLAELEAAAAAIATRAGEFGSTGG